MKIKLATAILWSLSFIFYALSMVFNTQSITRWDITCAICALVCASLYFIDYLKDRKNKML